MYASKLFGCNIVGGFAPIYGGYAGGPEGTAIVTVAEHLMSLMVHQADCYLPAPIHLYHTAGSSRELIWVRCVSAQAISRNTNLLTMYLSYTAAGPMTDYEDRMTPLEPLCDIETGEISAEYMELYSKVKKELLDVGIPLE